MLCKLFDSRRCTIAQFAEDCGLPPDLIVKATNKPGFRLSHSVRFRIGKVLSAYQRRFPEVRPVSEYEFAMGKRNSITPIESRLEKQTGVVQESSPRDDELVFSLRDDTGRWRYIVTTRADETDEEEIEVLWRLLKWKERRRLQIIG